jgi:ketosteroid isomerase-like protein
LVRNAFVQRGEDIPRRIETRKHMSSNTTLTLETSAPRVDRRTAILGGLAAASTAVALGSTASAADAKPENPELAAVHALLKTHDEAMTNHDLKGVTATLTEKAAIMGSGPGEMWVGPAEIKDAYEHFFQGYDKGQQEFEYKFKVGNLASDMGWLMASGNIKAKKDGKAIEFPINVSLTVAKAGGQWKIASMHFSTLTGPDKK